MMIEHLRETETITEFKFVIIQKQCQDAKNCDSVRAQWSLIPELRTKGLA